MGWDAIIIVTVTNLLELSGVGTGRSDTRARSRAGVFLSCMYRAFSDFLNPNHVDSGCWI